jgi:hypothetical protein
MHTATRLIGSVALGALAIACASSPAAPFNQLKDSNLTAYRLQNYEPPAPPPGAAPQANPMAGLPPQLQQWIQQGAQGLQQLIPPGLLPPGMLPPGTATAPAAPAQDTTPRFHTFRVLSQTAVIDPSLKEKLADILGDEDNFQAEHANCSYSEIGLSFSSAAGGAPNDLLISFSCNQVIPQSFQWPHKNMGMKPSTVKELSEVVNKLWPPGT